MTPVTMSASSLAKLENIKKDIRALLISMGSRDVTLTKLSKVYKDEVDEEIPFKDFYYTSLKEFLNSMPDILHLKYNNKNELCAYHIDTEKTAHISSLIARQKKPCKSDKSRFKPEHRNNRVNPQILKTVLQDLVKSSPNVKHGISKNDVLSRITNYLGRYALYTINDLNNQLVELTHLLTYDDDYIYFKNSLPNTKNNLHRSNVLKNNSLNLKNVNEKKTMFSTVGDLVKESTKKRLQSLVEKHADGIWCSELPTLYVKEYGLDLEYTELGFNSIIEFVGALPDILKIINPPNVKKQKVIDARKSESHSENTQICDSLDKLNENKIIDLDAVPISRLSPNTSKRLIPEGSMGIDDTVDQIRVNDLFESPDKYIDVIVSDVYSPTKFYVILRKNKRKRDKLMNQLQGFYSFRDLDKYKIPPIILQPGLHVACIFDNSWHRGVIKKVKPNEVMIFFYDYGTIFSYKPNQLYFLDKQFSVLSAQAIRCSLYNVKPIDKDKWSIKTVKKFLDKVMDNSFVVSIIKIDEENNFMTVNLIDTKNDKDEVHINEWMVTNKLAACGEFLRTKSNFTHKHHLQCTQNKDLLNTEGKKNITIKNIFCYSASDESNDSSPMTSQKKLEALRRYKEQLSNSLQSSSLITCINNIAEEKSSGNNISSTYNKVLNKQLSFSGSGNSEENSETDCSLQSSSLGCFNNDSTNEEKRFNNSISDIQDKLLDKHMTFSNSSNLNETGSNELYHKHINITNKCSDSSLYPSSFSSSSFDSDNYSSYNDSSNEENACNELMFKGCRESTINHEVTFKRGNSNRETEILRKTSINLIVPLKELRKLMSSKKL